MSRLIPLIRSLLINILGPYLAYRLVAAYFPANSPYPLLVSAAIPALDLAIVFTRRRRVDVIAIISLVQLAVSIAITLGSGSASAVIRGHALQPGAMGLVFAASILLGHPLIIPLARQTMAGDDPERQARFDSHMHIPVVRRRLAIMTAIWAVTLCAESAIRLAAAATLTPGTYLIVSSIISYGTIGTLIWGSITYGRRKSAQATA